MKRSIYFLTFALISLAFVGCSGEKNDEPLTGSLTLSSSKPTITANGTDKTTFTVMKGATNITDRAEIYLMTVDGVADEQKLTSNSFTSKKNGVYTFEARFETEKSPAVTVTASESGQKTEKYYRKVAVFKTTGTWCSFCPKAGLQLADLANRVYPDRIIELSFHGGNSKEPMLIPETDQLREMLKPDLEGYPAFATDLRVATYGADMLPITREAVKKSMDEYPATCGIRINSEVAGSKLNITAGITAEMAGSYRIAVVILESKLKYPDSPQLDGSLYYPDFQHNHVVRKVLSKSLIGDALGTLTANQEQTKTYTVDIDASWTLANLNVVVYAVDNTETINNIAECEANNGSVDYRLNTPN